MTTTIDDEIMWGEIHYFAVSDLFLTLVLYLHICIFI